MAVTTKTTMAPEPNLSWSMLNAAVPSIVWKAPSVFTDSCVSDTGQSAGCSDTYAHTESPEVTFSCSRRFSSERRRSMYLKSLSHLGESCLRQLVTIEVKLEARPSSCFRQGLPDASSKAFLMLEARPSSCFRQGLPDA